MRLKGISFFSHTWVRKLFGWPAIKKEALMSVGVSVWLLRLSVSASFRLCSSASELLFVRLCLSASDLSFSPVKSPSVHLTRAYLSVCLSGWLAGWLSGCLSYCFAATLRVPLRPCGSLSLFMSYLRRWVGQKIGMQVTMHERKQFR